MHLHFIWKKKTETVTARLPRMEIFPAGFDIIFSKNIVGG